MTNSELSAVGRIQEDGLPVRTNCSIESIESIQTYDAKDDLGGEGDDA